MYKSKRTASYLIGIILPLLIIASCNLFHTNTPPAITSTPQTQINENSEYSYFIQAEDPEEDALTYTLETKPSWLSLSGYTVSGTAPEVSADQNYTVKIKVSDGEEFDTQQFTIKVNDVPEENHPPQITSTPVTQVNERSTYEYYLQAEDVDEDELTYSVTSGPSWLSVSGSRIYGTVPEVDQDSSVAISVRVSDGIEHDNQSFNLLIINVPDPTVSQTVQLVNDVDIAYWGYLKDVDSAIRQIYHNDVLIDSLTTTISSRSYSDTLKGCVKGFWKFVLSADGATSDEKTVEVPNYNPTADVSGLEGMLDFKQGEIIALALPTPTDKNPEDNPVKYSSVESLDDKVSARIENDSLYITSKRGAIGPYSIKLSFGNENNGEGEATVSGEIDAPTIEWFNPFKRPVKGLAYYGSGDANQDGKIDS
ncbi:MAG: hypothetical protein U9Q91_08045, partial [Candidatus Marinimicrobia bacterium]|nr:hypothetical protein [Candidatus Neomarinimicrobiota bacterium]